MHIRSMLDKGVWSYLYSNGTGRDGSIRRKLEPGSGTVSGGPCSHAREIFAYLFQGV